MSLNQNPNSYGAHRPRRRVVQNGHLVHDSTTVSQQQRRRRRWIAVLLLVCALLFLTNPSNAPYTILSRRYYRMNSSTSKNLRSFFGLFSYQQTIFSLRIFVAGMKFNCRWDHPLPDLHHDDWRNQVCLWLSDTLDATPTNLNSVWRHLPRDNALLVYQTLLATLALINIPPWLAGSNHYWLGRIMEYHEDGGAGFLSPFLVGIYSVLTVTEYPTLFLLLRSCFEAHRIIYPALVRIQELVANQDDSSVFHVFNSDRHNNNNNLYNFVWTISCLMMLAATTDRLSVYLTHGQQQHHALRFEALLAICLGVLRGSDNYFFTMTTSLYHVDADPTFVYFGILIVCRVLLRQSYHPATSFDLGIFLIQVLVWMGGNTASAYMGQYLLEHATLLPLATAAKQLWTIANQWIFTPMDQLLQGIRNL